MIRVVLAALVALALFAVAAPAVRDARDARGDAAVDRLDRRLTRTVARLARTEAPTPPAVPGARRRLAVDVPQPSPTRAAVDRLRVRCHGPRRLTLTASVGGRRRQIPVESPVQVALAGDSPLRLTRDGTLRVGLRLLGGVATVVLAEGSSTVTRPPAPCPRTSNGSARTEPTTPVRVQSRSTGRPARTAAG